MGTIVTLLYSTVQYSAVQYSTVQYSAVPYSTIQYCTVQYSTLLHFVLLKGLIVIKPNEAKYVVKHKSAKLLMTYAVGKL